MSNGYVIFDGASLHNGKRIIAIALTSKSSNTKTGAMMQTYIITPHNPMYASKHGLDDATVATAHIEVHLQMILIVNKQKIESVM